MNKPTVKPPPQNENNNCGVPAASPQDALSNCAGVVSCQQQSPVEKTISGVLLIDKTSGWTSHDAVMVARRKLGISRIGHAGTLDPAATGLLVLLVGSAAKKQSEFQQAAKIYSGVMHFGVETDTWDADGKVVAQKPLPDISEEQLGAAISEITGDITQIVPPYSAVKFHGEPLYKIARRGGVLPKNMCRIVTIYSWDRREWTPPELAFTIKCSSGTYVRSLAQMLGAKFGCGAHLKSLRRLKVGDYVVESAISAVALKEMDRAEIESRIIALP